MPVPQEEDSFSQDQNHDEEYVEDDGLYDSEEDESAFVNFALLSHLAVRLRDRVPRGTHVKGSIPYPRAFTGKDIVVSAMGLTRNDMARNSRYSSQPSRPKYSENCSSTTASRRVIGGWPLKLLEVFKASSFSMM